MAEEQPKADPPVAKSGGWWSTLPGILTATAGVITAVTGLFAILSQNGVFGGHDKPAAALHAPDGVTSTASSPVSPVPMTSVDDKPTGAKQAMTEAIQKPAASVPVADGAGTGIAASPLHSMPFSGAIITQSNGSIVKLRDDIKERCQGQAVLKTTDGQLIEMKRMARFDIVDWRVNTGTVRITLNNGETIDAHVEACAMRGSNDLGDYQGDFDAIRSVVFVR